jgi:hypothetical protein
MDGAKPSLLRDYRDQLGPSAQGTFSRHGER